MDFTKQVERMVGFIEQEGMGRAEEIEARGDEEYNIYVGQKVQTERLRINAIYEKREAEVEKQKIIMNSSAINNSRLVILQQKEAVLDEIFGRAFEKIRETIKDGSRNKTVLEGLILQASLKLLVENQLVRVRQKDYNLASEVSRTVTGQYKSMTGLNLTIEVDKKHYLPDTILGGAVLYDKRGRHKVTNTLNYRIDNIRTRMMPLIRVSLFGSNPRRKFYI